jgi:glycerol-3-phosphate O-acyltransferase/dihydroxyacetone phosphate acyltransferase
MACAAPMERHFFSSEEGAASSTGPRAFIARVASRRKLAAQGETYEQLLKRGGSSSDEVPAGSSSERDPLMPAPTGVEGRGRYVHGWLLWLGIASVACLPPLGVPSLLSLAVAGLFVLCWIATNIALKSLVCSFIYLALEIFFREIGSRNTYKVPPEGQPCLFVCAPHANQFLDPFVVMMALGRQDIHFLTAAASMRKWCASLPAIPFFSTAHLYVHFVTVCMC